MTDGDMVDAGDALRRPPGIGTVLDAGVRLFRASLIGCLPYATLAAAAGQLPTAYAAATGQPLLGFRSTDALWWTLYAADTCLSFILWGSVLLRQQRVVRGLGPDAFAEVREACRRLPAVVGLAVPIAMALALARYLAAKLSGTILIGILAVPGSYLGVALSMSWPLLMIERQSPVAALRGSLRLVSGSWWRTATVLGAAFTLLVVFYVLGGVIGALVSAPLVAAPAVDPGSVSSVPAMPVHALAVTEGPALPLVRAVIFLLLGSLAVPWLTSLLLATYGDLIARRDTTPTAAAGADLRRNGS
jgi:hypothetical protein